MNSEGLGQLPCEEPAAGSVGVILWSCPRTAPSKVNVREAGMMQKLCSLGIDIPSLLPPAIGTRAVGRQGRALRTLPEALGGGELKKPVYTPSRQQTPPAPSHLSLEKCGLCSLGFVLQRNKALNWDLLVLHQDAPLESVYK